jgi:hypothetical protein
MILITNYLEKTLIKMLFNLLKNIPRTWITVRNYSSIKENVYFGCYGNPMPFRCNCDFDGTGYNRYQKLIKNYNQNNQKYTKTPYKDGFTNNYIKTNTGIIQIESDLYVFLPK